MLALRCLSHSVRLLLLLAVCSGHPRKASIGWYMGMDGVHGDQERSVQGVPPRQDWNPSFTSSTPWPSLSSSSAKVMISGIPLHAHFEDIEPLLKPYGKVEDCIVVSSKDPNTQTVHITFETYDQAQRYRQVETCTNPVGWHRFLPDIRNLQWIIDYWIFVWHLGFQKLQIKDFQQSPKNLLFVHIVILYLR